MARAIAAHEFPVAASASRDAETECAALSAWIKKRFRNITLGDRSLKYKDLKKLLLAMGCKVEKQSGNFIKIRYKNKSVLTGYPKGHFEVSVSEIKRIRATLQLDETHGVDSGSFYELEGTVDKFITTYRNLLSRLADL